MEKTALIFEKLLGKPVQVVASGYVVEGRLLYVETSTHNGFGNIILQTPNGPLLVRGSNVQTITLRERAASPELQPRNQKIKMGGENGAFF